MKAYDSALISEFSKKEYVSNVHGMDVTIKPIPDDDRPGVLDVREKPYAIRFLEKAAERRQKSLEDHRRETGNVNYNINTVEIVTDCVDILSEGRNVRIWVYYPRLPFDKKDRAAMVYFHGGSFFAGAPFMLENPCRFLAEAANAVVFNVDYSLAPEHPFPAGLTDCKNAVSYIYENAERFGIDPAKICVGGDSAGGNLAASVAISEVSDKIAMLMGLYPCTTFKYPVTPFKWDIADYEMDAEERAMIEPKLTLGRADGKGDDMLMLAIMQMYLHHGEDLTAPEISPLHGDLTKIKKAIIITAEFDGLRYHGEHFAKLLKEAGADVRAIRYRGVFHAFAEKIGFLPQAEDAMLEIAKAMAEL